MDLFSGGYFLTRPFPRPAWHDARLLPSLLVSACSCLASVLPDDWAISWVGMDEARRRERAAAFGLSREAGEAVVAFSTEALNAGDVLYPGIWSTLAAARRFLEVFPIWPDDVLLVGVGCTEATRDAVLEDAPVLGTSDGETGLIRLLRAGAKLDDGGSSLGWEVLCADGDALSHSWLCNGLEKIADSRLGLRAGRYGLWEDEATARAVAELVGSEEVGAEPGVWGAWAVVGYPINGG